MNHNMGFRFLFLFVFFSAAFHGLINQKSKAIELLGFYRYMQQIVYELKALHWLRKLTNSVFLKISSIHPSTEVQASATKIWLTCHNANLVTFVTLGSFISVHACAMTAETTNARLSHIHSVQIKGNAEPKRFLIFPWSPPDEPV